MEPVSASRSDWDQGNLNIKSPQYDKLGDIENGFTLTGYSLTVKGNVFGTVLSQQGIIRVVGNVIQGTVRNLEGNINVDGFISNAYLESIQGEVHIKRAENSKIRAHKLIIQEARNCTLLADEAEIGFMQNTVVTGKNISIRTAGLGHGIADRAENLIVVEVPDVDSLQQAIAELTDEMTHISKHLKKNLTRLELHIARKKTLVDDTRLKRYFRGLDQIRRLQASGQKIDPTILRTFAEEKTRLAPELLEIMTLNRAIKTLRLEVASCKDELLASRERKMQFETKLLELSHRINLNVQNIVGETIVRKRTVGSTILCLKDMVNPVEIRREFGFLGGEVERIFQGDKGNVVWEFVPLSV